MMETMAKSVDPRALARALSDGSELCLLLDYDGTLVPFAATPSRAIPDDDLLRLLAAVARRPRTHLEIVSGRDPTWLDGWFGELPLTLRAEHGTWVRHVASGGPWIASVPVRPRAVANAGDCLRAAVRPFGGFIEYKQSSAAWHYRNVAVSASVVERIVREVRDAMTTIGFDVIEGAFVVEVRVDGAHKGRAVADAFRRSASTTVVAIGDDVTDEDMFRALPRGREGVVVGDGSRATGAAHRLANHLEVRAFLTALVEQARC